MSRLAQLWRITRELDSDDESTASSERAPSPPLLRPISSRRLSPVPPPQTFQPQSMQLLRRRAETRLKSSGKSESGAILLHQIARHRTLASAGIAGPSSTNIRSARSASASSAVDAATPTVPWLTAPNASKNISTGRGEEGKWIL